MSGWPQPALPAQWLGTANLPPFVGRRPELEALEAIWPSVEAGARQVVCLAGEAGAGKSRLAGEAALALDRNGVSVLWGSCSPELGLPFDPFVQPVRTLLPAIDAGELALTGEGLDSIEETRDLLRLLTEGTTRGPGPMAGARAAVVFEAVAALLASATAARPVLLVLEDVHWAGESALRVLRFLVERTAGLRLLVIVTFRSTPPDRSEALSGVVGELMRCEGVHRLDLAGLDTDQVADYLSAVRAGTAEQVRQGAALLRDSTGGNPFVLREVWRDLERRGGLAGLASGAVAPPESLRAVITARLALLPPAQRRLVTFGAVIGQEFGIDLLRAATGAAGLPPAEAFAGLVAASAAGLVEPAAGRAGVLRFRHALARQAVLESLDPFELAAAHAQVGFALEEGFAAEEHRVQRLAHHFASAVGLGLDDRAVRYLEQAAVTAAERLANSDAALLFERAAAFAPDPDERDRLLLCAARSHHVAGHLPRALLLDERVSSSGNQAHRLEAAIGFEASTWGSGTEAPRAVALLDAALGPSLTDDPNPTEVLALASLGRAMALSGGRPEGLALTERAVAAARGGGSERLLVACLERSIRLQPDVSPGQGLQALSQQLAAAEEITVLAKGRGELRALATAAQIRILGAYVLADPVALDEARHDLAITVRVTRQPYWHWCEYLVDASRCMLRCEFGEAAELVATGRRLESAFEQPRDRAEGPWSLQWFMLRREVGGLEFARRYVEGLPPPSNPWRPGLVALCTELGLAEQAGKVLRDALERDLALLRESSTWPAALSFLGEAAAWLGDRESARLLLEEAECFAGLNLLGAEFLAALGSADRLLAVLKGSLGLPGVEDHFATALATDQRMGAPLHVATTQAQWAAHLRRVRAPAARVEEHAAPARQLADRHDLMRVRRILGQDARVGRPSLPDGLTGRELDVLRLIGRGASNRDIAGELVISEYTAANHVRSILMKTRCANRTAAAHYAVQHGLMEGRSDDVGQ